MKNDFRNYEQPARDSVEHFYQQNHREQTLAFVHDKKAEFLSLDRSKMGAWEALEYLDSIIDDSDPDTELSQLDHALQTAEAIRNDGHPDWFVLTGLIHDLGKILCTWGEPQWAVVGDTFPLGVQFSEKIVYPRYFAENPDSENSQYQTENGIYHPGCGLDQITISWGHDEYLYHVMKPYLPQPALYMIRYHSFYSWHQHGEYDQFMNQQDKDNLPWVRAFNPYDLYSKGHEPPDRKMLEPFYRRLIKQFLPDQLCW